jgi:hypothetical protein
MPLSRPACLRPMLKRQEYRQFAERINARVEWRLFSWEALSFFVISILAPPLSSYLMVSACFRVMRYRCRGVELWHAFSNAGATANVSIFVKISHI